MQTVTLSIVDSIMVLAIVALSWIVVEGSADTIISAIDRNTCVQSGASLAVCKARYSGED